MAKKKYKWVKDFTYETTLTGRKLSILEPGQKPVKLECNYCNGLMLVVPDKQERVRHVCPECGRMWAVCSEKHGGCGKVFLRNSKLESVCAKCRTSLNTKFLENRSKYLLKARRKDGLDFKKAAEELAKEENQA